MPVEEPILIVRGKRESDPAEHEPAMDRLLEKYPDLQQYLDRGMKFLVVDIIKTEDYWEKPGAFGEKPSKDSDAWNYFKDKYGADKLHKVDLDDGRYVIFLK